MDFFIFKNTNAIFLHISSAACKMTGTKCKATLVATCQHKYFLLWQPYSSLRATKLQVTFAQSPDQGLCVITADRNLYPLCVKCQTRVCSHMDTSRSSVGGHYWQNSVHRLGVSVRLSGSSSQARFRAKTWHTLQRELLPHWPGGQHTFAVHYWVGASWRSGHQHCGTDTHTWWQWGILRPGGPSWFHHSCMFSYWFPVAVGSMLHSDAFLSHDSFDKTRYTNTTSVTVHNSINPITGSHSSADCCFWQPNVLYR